MRMIDADALETHEQLEPMGNGMYEYVQVVYKDDIDDAPTITPERKRGQWLNIDESEKWECSECGRMMWFSSRLGVKSSDYNFCPNCGADMRGK